MFFLNFEVEKLQLDQLKTVLLHALILQARGGRSELFPI